MQFIGSNSNSPLFFSFLNFGSKKEWLLDHFVYWVIYFIFPKRSQIALRLISSCEFKERTHQTTSKSRKAVVLEENHDRVYKRMSIVKLQHVLGACMKLVSPIRLGHRFQDPITFILANSTLMTCVWNLKCPWAILILHILEGTHYSLESAYVCPNQMSMFKSNRVTLAQMFASNNS